MKKLTIKNNQQYLNQLVDHISKKHRSWNMAQIRSENTKPEVLLRSLLHINGYRFRLHRKDLPGKPDIVLPKYKAVIFVHGCFWHRHKNCGRATTPKSKTEWWLNKFGRNTARDKKNKKELRKSGWNPIVVWECEIKKENSRPILAKIKRYLG